MRHDSPSQNEPKTPSSQSRMQNRTYISYHIFSMIYVIWYMYQVIYINWSLNEKNSIWIISKTIICLLKRPFTFHGLFYNNRLTVTYSSSLSWNLKNRQRNQTWNQSRLKKINVSLKVNSVLFYYIWCDLIWYRVTITS